MARLEVPKDPTEGVPDLGRANCYSTGVDDASPLLSPRTRHLAAPPMISETGISAQSIPLES